MAAAIGAGQPVMEPAGSMIVDIGGGTTEVAVISLGGIVASRSIRIAGDEMDQEIIVYARQKHNLLIGERSAEQIKIAAGSAYPLDDELEVTLRGRDVVTGLPKEISLSSVEIREAISGSVASIVDAVKTTIEITPPELIADLMEFGIALAGGGALLRGLDQRISHETKFRAYVADDPLSCVVKGTGQVLDDLDRLRKVLVQLQYTKPPRYG